MKADIEPFIISRLFHAPLATVYQAWTEKDKMEQWWGPKGVEIHVLKLEVKPGGVTHYLMKNHAGMDMWGKSVYQAVQPLKQIEFLNSFADADENIVHHPMSDTWPLEMYTTIRFEEHDGGTLVTIEWLPWNSTPEEIRTFEEGRESMKIGWTGSLDQLTEYLSKN